MISINRKNFDFKKYKTLLKAIASMSRLYNDNNTALIHSRFVEKLYITCSKSRDLTRKDGSFDAILDNIAGVGIKTFVATNNNTNKSEKIAEFTKNASLGDFQNFRSFQIAKKSAELRNNRIISDVNEYSLNLNECFYHCLVRTSENAIIHEEPYSLINIENITPTDKNSNELSSFPKRLTGNSYFYDGTSSYIYNKSKNVLFKKFELSKNYNSEVINLPIHEDIFERILVWTKLENETHIEIQKDLIIDNKTLSLDFVILPLYSTEAGNRIVHEKSGINQWNAGGRKRKFGESYIPIPSKIHQKNNLFFPEKDVVFKIKLPNKKIIKAKVCQDNNKALMSNPNHDLCDWLYSILDKTHQISEQRFITKDPYTYDDLKSVGKDAIKVTKVSSQEHQYEIESAEIGSYEKFINNQTIE